MTTENPKTDHVIGQLIHDESKSIEILGKKSKRKYIRKQLKSDVGTASMARVVDLALKGVNTEEIQSVTGVEKNKIAELMYEFKTIYFDLETINKFSELRREILSAIHLQLIKSINDSDKLAKASIKDLASASASIHQQLRLESDLSTSNHSVKQQLSVYNVDKYR